MLGNRTCMHLKPTTFYPIWNGYLSFLNHIVLSNYGLNRQVVWIEEDFFIFHKSRKQTENLCGHINARKVFRGSNLGRWRLTTALHLRCKSSNEYDVDRINLKAVALWHCPRGGAVSHAFEFTGLWSDLPCVKQGVGIGWFVSKCCTDDASINAQPRCVSMNSQIRKNHAEPETTPK